MSKLLACALLLAASSIQAPPHFTARDFAQAEVDQCVEDAQCSTDSDCAAVEVDCWREVTEGRS